MGGNLAGFIVCAVLPYYIGRYVFYPFVSWFKFDMFGLYPEHATTEQFWTLVFICCFLYALILLPVIFIGRGHDEEDGKQPASKEPAKPVTITDEHKKLARDALAHLLNNVAAPAKKNKF